MDLLPHQSTWTVKEKNGDLHVITGAISYWVLKLAQS